jgi:octaprenyl-diphosphate synthase
MPDAATTTFATGRSASSSAGAPLGGAPTPERFLALVAEKLARTEVRIHEHLGSDVPFIEEAGRYLASAGGKRLRPAMLLLAARLLGHDGEEEITYATVVEFIHTATLVHDDVIDHAALRRGRRTIHELWGNNRTVLLGDWLYTTAMNLALSHGNVEVIRRLCHATLGMTEGELLVLNRLGASDLSVAEYFDIIERKTARLFAAACSVPALVGRHDPVADGALRCYGQKLGLLFQLVDDRLDFTAREDEVGKPVLSDLKEGKLTLPLILAMPRLRAAERERITTVLADRSFERVAPDEILELVQREGTLEEVDQHARDLAAEAVAELARFPASEARDALEFAPHYVLHRRT